VIALPEGRPGKIAAIAILILVILTVYFAIFSPVLAYYENMAETLEQRRELLRRYESAVNELPRLRAQQKQRRTGASAAQFLLTGASDAIATAALQANLKDIVESNGAEIASSAMLPSDTAGALRRTGVRVAFSGDLQLVTAVLLEIEAAHPVLSVENLELHRATGNGNDDENPHLAVSLDVFGFRAK
jgi:general secretion pathway protein M